MNQFDVYEYLKSRRKYLYERYGYSLSVVALDVAISSLKISNDVSNITNFDFLNNDNFLILSEIRKDLFLL